MRFLSYFWEQRKLQNILEVNSGKDYKHLNDGDIPVYGTGGLMLQVNEALSYDQDAIGIGRKGTIDKLFLLKSPFWTVDTLFYCIPKINSNLFFIYGVFQKINWKKMDESTGVPSLSKNTINNISINIPTLNEQNRIGKLLIVLDKSIALHQRKLDRLKNLKKAILQLMFPEKNHSAPKLRFNNFSEVWEQRKLSEEAVITMGQSPNGKNYTDNPNDYILIQGNADMKNGKVAPRVWTTQVTKTADPKDIILSVRAPVGDVGKTDFHAVLGRGVAGIKGNEFLYQALVWMKMFGYWTKVSTGSTFESINSTDLKNAIISCPGNNEQR
ncbi:restriction endonuclease subunit S [Aerococcaceae bacterium DSM 111021]|nr:restriction endonuclease subunit S [Aerococcaceae bacterium DSM 111021]